MSCYCRGFGLCDTCEQHVCTGDCTCDPDPTPNTYPNQSGEEAWTEKKELTS